MNKKILKMFYIIPFLLMTGCDRRGFIDSVKAICYFHYEDSSVENPIISGECRIAINTYAENKYLNRELKHRIEGYQTFEITTDVKFQYEISVYYLNINYSDTKNKEKQKLTIFDDDRIVASYNYTVNFILDN